MPFKLYILKTKQTTGVVYIRKYIFYSKNCLYATRFLVGLNGFTLNLQHNKLL